MTTHLRLTRVVGPALSTNRKDVLSVKTALNRLGLFHDPEHGITPFPEPRMFESIKRFQRARPGCGRRHAAPRPDPRGPQQGPGAQRRHARHPAPHRPPAPRRRRGCRPQGPTHEQRRGRPGRRGQDEVGARPPRALRRPRVRHHALPDRGLFEGIRKFQILRGLEPDGVVSRRGPTLATLNAELKAEGTRSDKRQTDGIRQNGGG